MRFVRVLKEQLFSEKRFVLDASEHKFEMAVGKPVEDSLGATRRPFVLRIDGENMVRHIFYTSTAFIETDIERWTFTSETGSCVFIPEYGRLVYIKTDTLEKVSLPDQAMEGDFIGNKFFQDFLIVLYQRSVMITYIPSAVSSCYKFDFELIDIVMLDTRFILLLGKDGQKIKFDRNKLSFVSESTIETIG